MMQSGLSRELFEMWCTDSRNCCIVAGYCVEGTLAKHIQAEPEEITTMNGNRYWNEQTLKPSTIWSSEFDQVHTGVNKSKSWVYSGAVLIPFQVYSSRVK